MRLHERFALEVSMQAEGLLQKLGYIPQDANWTKHVEAVKKGEIRGADGWAVYVGRGELSFSFPSQYHHTVFSYTQRRKNTPFQIHYDIIENIMKGKLLIVPPSPDEPYLRRLHNMEMPIDKAVSLIIGCALGQQNSTAFRSNAQAARQKDL